MWLSRRVAHRRCQERAAAGRLWRWRRRPRRPTAGSACAPPSAVRSRAQIGPSASLSRGCCRASRCRPRSRTPPAPLGTGPVVLVLRLTRLLWALAAERHATSFLVFESVENGERWPALGAVQRPRSERAAPSQRQSREDDTTWTFNTPPSPGFGEKTWSMKRFECRDPLLLFLYVLPQPQMHSARSACGAAAAGAAGTKQNPSRRRRRRRWRWCARACSPVRPPRSRRAHRVRGARAAHRSR